MAFFKFRWPGRGGQDDTARAAPSRGGAQPESVEVLRRRARHRLIGAAVLLVAGVVGFPILFDTQPRPIPVDIPITIPGRDQSPALVLPGAQSAQGSDAPVNVAQAPSQAPAPAATPAPAPAAAPRPSLAAPPLPPLPGTSPAPAAAPKPASAPGVAGLDAGEEVIASSRKPATPPKPEAKPETKPEAKPARPEAKPEAHAEARPKPETKPDTKPEKPAAKPAHGDDGARALALLEGRTLPASAPASTSAAAPATAAEGRFVVQVGAFSDIAKAQEARAKLAHSGLKTYMQSVDTKDGKRHRVRVGPFASRAEADKAAGRVKGLDLPASVLTL